jgi:hypothetical protein
VVRPSPDGRVETGGVRGETRKQRVEDAAGGVIAMVLPIKVVKGSAGQPRTPVAIAIAQGVRRGKKPGRQMSKRSRHRSEGRGRLQRKVTNACHFRLPFGIIQNLRGSGPEWLH